MVCKHMQHCKKALAWVGEKPFMGNGGRWKYFGIIGCGYMEKKGLASVQEVMMDTYGK